MLPAGIWFKGDRQLISLRCDPARNRTGFIVRFRSVNSTPSFLRSLAPSAGTTLIAHPVHIFTDT